MGNKPCDTKLCDKAAKYAIDAHAGTERRGKGYPYVIHVMEAASIVASITNDPELIAAAFLHDVIEDTDHTAEDIEKEFGKRIADLVVSESDVMVEGVSEEDSWHDRKQAAIDRIAASSYDSKIVAMGDKLSNMRAIARDYEAQGDELWNLFHNNDPKEHKWHYEGLAGSLKDLEATDAYKEFVELINKTFKKY